MKYKIGQILYVLLSHQTKICPVQVVEEIVKRTITGETTIYMVRVGKTIDTIPLSDLEGTIYESIDSLWKSLHEKITRSVETIVKSTINKAAEWYPNAVKTTDNVILKTSQDAIEEPELPSFSLEEQSSLEQETIVTLPDGTVAKIKGPIPGM